VCLLEVTVASGPFGPVLVLAGEADLTSVTRLDDALTAQIFGQAQLTVDATDPAIRRFGVDENTRDGGHEDQDPGRKRDAAESAAAGSQDAGLAARRRAVLDPARGQITRPVRLIKGPNGPGCTPGTGGPARLLGAGRPEEGVRSWCVRRPKGQ
jgi:hypothetical protein